MTLCQHPDCEQEGKYISRICGGPIVCKEHTEWGYQMLHEWSEISDEQYSLADFMFDKTGGNT